MNLTPPKLFKGLGVLSIIISVLMVGAVLWDIFFSAGMGIRTIRVPGLNEVDLDRPGVYLGMVQNKGSESLEPSALLKLETHLYFRETSEEIPIMLNSQSRAIQLFGSQSLLLFSFLIDKPGLYTLTAFYPLSAVGPEVSAVLVPQPDHNPRQTLLLGGLFMAVFLGLGIFLIWKGRQFSKNIT